MRTTVDLPDELMRAAKAHAARRGESLKELFTRLVAAEVRTRTRQPSGARVPLPLVGDPGGEPVEITNEDIEAALAEDDVEKYA